MSFIAQRPVRPAESDVTDVDDGGAQIAVGTFWPTVKLHDLRLAARIAGDIYNIPINAYGNGGRAACRGSVEGLAQAKGSGRRGIAGFRPADFHR